MNELIFKDKRTLMLGYSDYAEGWTDGYYEIYINCSQFKKYSDKGSLIFGLFNLLAHEYAHDEDDTNETNHDSNFYKRYYKIINKKESKIGKFLLNSNLKKLDEKYIEEINNAVYFSKDVKKLK